MPADIRGYVAEALATLSPSQIDFLQRLPKAELHAHLNGSIPLSIIRELAKDYKQTSPQFHKLSFEQIQEGVKQLEKFDLDDIHGFFAPFAIIYSLTSTRENLQKATRAVLAEFLDGDTPQCSYLELRSTPREAVEMTRLDYVQTVLDEVEKYPKDKVALIVSLDRKMKLEVMQEVIDIAKKLKAEGRRVVGVDLCGDPLAGDMYSEAVAKCFEEARNAGLKVTLHIAETKENPIEESVQLLSFKPNRVGHATFLNDEAKAIVLKEKIAIEICLSSNLLCKTVTSLDAHHIRYYLENDHPIGICTDDILPFRNSLLGEYALLLAKAPYGLGLSEDEVTRIAKMSMESRFA
ncbi:hypothetical protein VKT23_008456 [Stygiomarasmius scandens]|uniref:Adenosine deaminase domain-containing protein n=1 Tax=Marasmiellus scandens TaxID=2682957 RepID=A0ABR1JIS9_9AGAR